MRFKINFTKNTELVSVNNQSLVNSYIHTCLGRNNPYHDAKNDYSVSTLQGGRLNEDKLTISLNNGGFIVVTSLNVEFLNKLLIGLIGNPKFFAGMTFCGADYIEENFFDGWNHFATLSPFLIKAYVDKKSYGFLTLNDADFEVKVKEYLIKKLTAIDSSLDLKNFDVKIPEHTNHKVKSIMIHNVVNKANQCQISIHTNKKVAKLLYSIGLGQSTGSGFGTIYKTENRAKYIG